MLNGIDDSQLVRAEKAAMLSQSTGAGSSFFSRQSEIEQLNETLGQQDEARGSETKYRGRNMKP
jgi:hypothetical protein